MIVVDTSAAMAILVDEPAGSALAAVLTAEDDAVMSAASLVELGMVLEGRIGAVAGQKIDQFVRDMGIEIVPVDRPGAERSLEGWRRFGKGRHPAGLNLGDCFTYGLAATLGHPILCTGDDFARTDVAVVPVGP